MAKYLQKKLEAAGPRKYLDVIREYNENIIIRVRAIIVDEYGKILVIGNKWWIEYENGIGEQCGPLNVPGGLVEPTDKTVYDALNREVKEEVFLDISAVHSNKFKCYYKMDMSDNIVEITIAEIILIKRPENVMYNTNELWCLKWMSLSEMIKCKCVAKTTFKICLWLYFEAPRFVDGDKRWIFAVKPQLDQAP